MTGGADNGSHVYMFGYNSGATVSKIGGGAFTLNSFDFGKEFSGSDITVGYVLNLASGGTQTGSFTGNGAFQTLALGQTITSISFGLPTGGNAYIAIDNLSYDEAAAVPEPAMLGLFGMGAIGLGLARRRKSA